MHEHRLIERMVALITEQSSRIKEGEPPDSAFIAEAVEFFRVYADRCHHGKEEDLLFAELRHKDLPQDLKVLTDQLIEEHKRGRRLVGDLEQANQAPRESGGEAEKVVNLLEELADFYPRHIEKEDKHFFFPVMEYFTREEMDAMLEDFAAFDQRMIHEAFTDRVERREKGD